MSAWGRLGSVPKRLFPVRSCVCGHVAPNLTAIWSPLRPMRGDCKRDWNDSWLDRSSPVKSLTLLFTRQAEQVADLQRDSGQNVEAALNKRPEMAAVRSLIEAARERVRSSQGGLLPRLGTNAQYVLDSRDLGTFADSWFVAVQATWPLFEGGLSISRIQEARSRVKEIEARGEQIALDIALEVSQATLAVRETAEKIQVAEERKRWAEKALAEVRQIYSKQAVTVDSLLQAEVAWNQAEVSYTASLYEGKIAQALLRRALGDFAEGMAVAGE